MARSVENKGPNLIDTTLMLASLIDATLLRCRKTRRRAQTVFPQILIRCAVWQIDLLYRAQSGSPLLFFSSFCHAFATVLPVLAHHVIPELHFLLISNWQFFFCLLSVTRQWREVANYLLPDRESSAIFSKANLPCCPTLGTLGDKSTRFFKLYIERNIVSTPLRPLYRLAINHNLLVFSSLSRSFRPFFLPFFLPPVYSERLIVTAIVIKIQSACRKSS